MRMLTVENKERKKQGLPKFYSPNHSQDFRTLDPLELIAVESLEQIKEIDESLDIDYFIPAIGNGATVLGPGKRFKEENSDIKIIAWEPFASGKAFDMQTGDYKELYGIDVGTLKHKMYGTGVPDVDFPFITEAIGNEEPGIVDKVKLIADRDMFSQYRDFIDPLDFIGKQVAALSKVHQYWIKAHNIPFWEQVSDRLQEIGFDVGRSSAGGVAVALDIAEHVKNKNFLVLFYDKAWKYEDKSLDEIIQ